MKRTHSALVGTALAIALVCRADGRQDKGPQGARRSTSIAQPVAPSDDEKAIQASGAAFDQAFQNKDAKAIANLFTEDGEAVDLEGNSSQGRSALEEHYSARFAEMPGDKLETTIETIKVLAPGVARETGRTRVLSSEDGNATVGRYSAIRIKREGRWLLASVREVAENEITHYERLKELEWLVGDWVEETEEAVVLTSVAWADDKNFLLRSFDIRVKGKPALTGTQRIGWDPLTKQIKCWVFDSRGGYGDGLWMRSGDQWVIKATGVRPDGRTATATQVLTFVNKDRLRWKSIDRTLGDEIVQEIDEIVMVRKPPQPK